MALVGRRQPLLLLVGRSLTESWRTNMAARDAACSHCNSSEMTSRTRLSSPHARSLASKTAGVVRPQLSLDALVKKAEEGDVHSKFLLGSAYLKGQLGAKKDLEKARGMFEQAAAEEHKQSLFNLGVMYLEGLGVSSDAVKAASLFQRASALGVAEAQYNLGNLYHTGTGVDRDVKAAAEQFVLAAAQGDHKACLRLALAYISGDGVTPDSTLARDILQRPAREGNSEAQFLLGYVLLNMEDGTEQSINDALQHLEASAGKGFVAAKHYLGMCLLKGHKLKPDMTRASSLLQEAALEGHGQSAYELHKVYKEGKNLDVESRKWLQRAAELGVAEAVEELNNASKSNK